MLEYFNDFVISMLLLGEIMTRYIYITIYIYICCLKMGLFQPSTSSLFSVVFRLDTAKLRPCPFRASCSTPVVGQRWCPSKRSVEVSAARFKESPELEFEKG